MLSNSPSEQLKRTNDTFKKHGLLNGETKKKHEKLVAEQQELEKEAMVDLFTKMMTKDFEIDDDVYGDGDQSSLKGICSSKCH